VRKENIPAVLTTIIIAALFTLILCNNAKPATADDYFSDTGGRWSKLVIEKCNALGLMSGYPDKTFKPDNPVSRLEAIVITLNAMGKKQEALSVNYKESTVKLPAGMTWGQGYIVLAVQEGLLREDIAPLLEYENPITRQEMASVFVVALWDKIKENRGDTSKLTFTDVDDIGPDYLPYVADICQNDIMHGLENNEFGPKQNLKREQMAALLVKTIEDGWFETGGANFITGVITELDKSNMIISITKADGTEITGVLDENAQVYKDNEDSTLNELEEGDAATAITGQDDLIKYIESTSDSPSVDIVAETNITGKIVNRSLTGTTALKIRDCSYQEHIYTLATALSITEGTESRELSSLTDGTYVTLKIKNNAIYSIQILQSDREEGEVTAVGTDSFTIYTNSGEEIEYEVKAESLKITRGAETAPYSELKSGDWVIVISVFGEAQEIITSDLTINNAQIRTVDPEYLMVALLNLDNNVRKEYAIESDAVIRKGTELLTLESLKKGDLAKVTINADGKISAIVFPVPGEQTISGTVTGLKTGSSPSLIMEGETYIVSPLAYITRNNKDVDLSSIMIGSEVKLTLENDNTVTGIEVTVDRNIWITGETLLVSSTAGKILIEQDSGLQFTIPLSESCTFSDEVSASDITSLSDIKSGWILNMYLNSEGYAEQIKVTKK